MNSFLGRSLQYPRDEKFYSSRITSGVKGFGVFTVRHRRKMFQKIGASGAKETSWASKPMQCNLLVNL